METTGSRRPRTPELGSPRSGSTSLALGVQDDGTSLAVGGPGPAMLHPAQLPRCPSLGLCSPSPCITFPQQRFLPERGEKGVSSLPAARGRGSRRLMLQGPQQWGGGGVFQGQLLAPP